MEGKQKPTKKPSKMSNPAETTKDPKPNKKLSSLEDLHSEVKDMINPMKSSISTLKTSIDLLLEMKTAWENSLQDYNTLRTHNSDLTARLTKVELDNKQLNDRLQHLENKLLECNVVFQGVPDSVWEPMETTREKVLTAISYTISGDSQEQKMDQARNIPIKEVYRIGKYTAMRTRPVVVEFCYKSAMSFLLSNKSVCGPSVH